MLFVHEEIIEKNSIYFFLWFPSLINSPVCFYNEFYRLSFESLTSPSLYFFILCLNTFSFNKNTLVPICIDITLYIIFYNLLIYCLYYNFNNLKKTTKTVSIGEPYFPDSILELILTIQSIYLKDRVSLLRFTVNTLNGSLQLTVILFFTGLLYHVFHRLYLVRNYI